MVAEGGVDADTLGRATWTFLHTLAATHPEKPSETEKARLARFMKDFSEIYPCAPCAESFRDIMKRNPVETDSGSAFSKWMCVAHNEVNKELGKELFDCNKIADKWGVCESCATHQEELSDFKSAFAGFASARNKVRR